MLMPHLCGILRAGQLVAVVERMKKKHTHQPDGFGISDVVRDNFSHFREMPPIPLLQGVKWDVCRRKRDIP